MSLKEFSKSANTPQFCVIAPTSYLEDYAIQSHTHLVLAHIVDTDPVYAKFYHEMSDRGDKIIMDNGAFELGQSYHPEKLIELGQLCGADAIVLPDYPGQHSSVTLEAAKEWAPLIKEEGFKTMFVPQSEVGDIDDWISGYLYASNSILVDIIGMSILGIPNALPHIPKAYARVVMSELLIDRGILSDKYHHYLGLNAAPNVEIPALILMGALDSCDSSNPVWTALQGIGYNITQTDYMGIKKRYIRDVDFGEKMSNNTHIQSLIQQNLDITFDIFKYPKKHL